MSTSAGLKGLSVAFPGIVRTNAYWHAKAPEIVADAQRRTLARVFSPIDPNPDTEPFDTAMAPFLGDPFRGTVERRVLAPGESGLVLEARASRDALAAARLSPDDVELLITCSFLPDQLGPGNAPFLAKELGLRCPGWNLESTCNSTIVALETASALVRAGQYRNVLVAVSCIYSRLEDPKDSLSWFLGDGAGAFVIGQEKPGRGILGSKIITSNETCNGFLIDLVRDERGEPALQVHAGKNSSKALRDTASRYLRVTAEGALAQAGVSLKNVRGVVVNTPTAWHSQFAASVLGIDPERILSTYHRYGNIGPALTVANLYHSARHFQFQPDDLVLVYAVGSSSTTGAVVMRWGEVGLGPEPAPSSSLPQQ